MPWETLRPGLNFFMLACLCSPSMLLLVLPL